LKQLRALIVALAAAALASCSLSTPAKPSMWRVSDGDTTVWLLGSMHLLPSGTDWRGDAVDGAIADADALVLESDPQAKGDFESVAKAPGLTPLAERLGPDKQDALRKAIARTGQPGDAFDGYKDWAAAVMLGTGDALDAGATTKNGVDAQLWADFKRRKRGTIALEEPGAQLHALDILPPELQHLMLEDAIAGPGYDSVLGAWSDGDVAALDKATGPKNLRAFLVVAPNKRWSDWIAKRMAQPGKLLVAVGAGHLVGKDSIVEMLTARGFNVVRVQ
jgi:uncharacterized protein YbaP (TraB family)